MIGGINRTMRRPLLRHFLLIVMSHRRRQLQRRSVMKERRLPAFLPARGNAKQLKNIDPDIPQYPARVPAAFDELSKWIAPLRGKGYTGENGIKTRFSMSWLPCGIFSPFLRGSFHQHSSTN